MNTLFHTLYYFLDIDDASTQTTSNEREKLWEYAQGAQRAVEIGVAEGANTRLIAEALSEGGTLYAIDPFFGGRLGICWGELIAKDQVRRGNVERRVQFVRALSWDACDQIEGTFDFIFVDGDHSLEGIKRDWSDWSGRVRPGGIIALHDTQVPTDDHHVAGFGSSKYFKAEIQYDDRFRIIDQVDTLSVLRRKNQPGNQ